MTTTGDAIPRLPRHLLQRPQLEAVLDDGAPLTIVYGVQGYGKTTLLAAWAQRRAAEGVAIHWITATERLDDAEALAEALPERFPEGAVLVVDDLHFVENDEAVRLLLETLDRDAGMRIVVSTRRRHRIETLAEGDIETRILPSHELTLIVPEIVKLSELLGRPIGEDDARLMRSAVGGWMAAACIIIEASRPGSPVPVAAARRYLLTKVLPSVRDEETLAQLTRFALAVRVDTKMIRELAGAMDPDRLLEALDRPGLLEPLYRADRVELRYPSLVRELLRETFEERDPVAARAAHGEFARWFRKGGEQTDPMAAFEHAVKAEDWELVEAVWRDHGALLGLAFPERFYAAIRRIPIEAVGDERGLRVALDSVASVVGRVDREVNGANAWFRAYSEASAREFSALSAGQPLLDLLHFGTGRIIGLRLAGRLDDAEVLAVELGELARARLAQGEFAGDRFGYFALQIAITHHAVGDLDEAIRDYALAWEHSARGMLHGLETNAAGNLGLIHAFRSEPEAARRWLERQRDDDSDNGLVHYLTDAPGQVAEGILHLDRLEADAYLQWVARIGGRFVPLDVWPLLEWAAAQHALHYGDPTAALIRLDDAERERRAYHDGQELYFPLLARARADLLIAADRGRDAAAVLDEHPAHEFFAVPRARLTFLADEFAATRVVVAAAAVGGSLPVRDRIELLLLDALAALRLGERDAAAESARRAIELQQSSGALRVLATIGPGELDEVLSAGEVVLSAGERALVDSAARVYPGSIAVLRLTELEEAVLEALDRGFTRKRIGEVLYLSSSAVSAQLRSLYEKLGVSSHEDALRAARAAGLL